MKNNPYIGPRPYERQHRDKFFGRKREARELCVLIRSEREVLFYAQSGAGKTSLLNASVIPTLEEEDFVVLPVARVGSELPLGIAADQVDNVFVFSTLLTLAGEDADPQALLHQTLRDYLAPLCDVRISNGGMDENTELRPVVLILDQFEEIFTTHRERWQEAAGFFQQMREALDTLPNLGVVLAMREDHVAAIDPYAPLFPRRLRARFRMERLGPRGALAAVKRPAANAGCRYDPGVAERLVDNLRRIKVRPPSIPPTGGIEGGQALGPYVEPVQLQVVCSRLWAQLPEQEDHAIQWEEVEQYGDIDQALTDFYESAVVAAVKRGDVNERQVRRWFGEELITSAETRGLVLRGDAETADLPNAAVDALEAAHIIRAERRAGARWYELAHDRLVEPILDANRVWEAAQAQLHPWRPAARQWQQAQSETLLYRGEELEAAQAWLEAADPGAVEAYEREFIEASQAAQQARVRRRRIRTVVGIGTFVLIFIMAALTLSAVKNRRAADRQALSAIENQITALEASGNAAQNAQEAAQNAQVAAQNAQEAAQNAQVAHINQLSAQALAFQTRQYDLALLLSVEAFKRAPDSSHARNSLLHTLQYSPRLDTFLQGHSGYVGSVAFSKDGAMLASGSGDNTIILWDVATRSQVDAPLTGHNGYVASVAFSPVEKLLASGGQDGRVILWDVTTHPPVETLLHQRTMTPVLSVTFSRDGKLLASSSWDGTIRMWDTATRQPVGEPFTHTASVASVAFAPDGEMLAAGSLDNTITLWDVATRQAVGVPLTGHTGPVLSVAFARYGNVNILASGSWDGTIRLWDISEIREPALLDPVLTGHKAPVLNLASTGEGSVLASASADNTIMLWDVETHKSTGEPLVGHSNRVRSVAFSPDGKMLASGSYDKNIILWNVSPEPLGYDVLTVTQWVKSMAFSPDGRILAAGGKDNLITLWDMTSRQSFDAPIAGGMLTDSVTSLAFAPSGETLASGHTDQTVILWDVSNPHTPAQLSVFTEHAATVNSVAFAPDADVKLLASASADAKVILWDISNPHTPTHLSTLTGHTGPVNCVVFAPEGEMLASASDDKTVILWDVSNPREPVTLTQPLTAHHGEVVSLAFAPDGKTLASGSWDNVIILWDISDPHAPLAQRLTGHRQRVLSLAFAPDGKTLASGSRDNTIILWDVGNVGTPQRLGRPLTGHSSSVESVMFAPDHSQTLVSAGSLDNEILLWDVAPASWVTRACRMANRNLMQAEWARFMSASDEHRETCSDLPLVNKSQPDSYKQVEDYLIARDKDILQAEQFFAGQISLSANAGGIERQIADLWNEQNEVLIENSERLEIEPPAAVAFVIVQSGGRGFGADGRMLIRFENHIFWDRWGKNNPELYEQHFTFDADRRWIGHQWRPSPDEDWRTFHGDQAGEWEAFEFARTLDETAAMESISMGGPQLMGFNYNSMEYASVQDMFEAWNSSEAAQLDGLFKFIESRGSLVEALQAEDFVAFARSYNGPGQAEAYGSLMQQAYDTFKALMQP